jgi:hypothetical protein
MKYEGHRANLITLGLMLLLSASITRGADASEHNVSELFIEPKAGEYYGNARFRMIDVGWHPVAAKCSPQSPCFGNYPELGTNGDKNPLCGLFKKENATAKICVHSINDSFKVDTFEYVH